jgi:LAS superfamily LD-carboxypeptidase LdcB
MTAANIEVLTGADSGHIDYSLFESGLHHGAVAAFGRLQEVALAQGFDMVIASSFRSFDRQLLIWNEKALGLRPLYDSSGHPLAYEQLSPWELAQAILRWSALPGASRHHWGTDLDIYDRAVVPEGYQVQLSPREVSEGGPFHPLHSWLDRQLATDSAEGFFRPYDRDRGGVAPERWHLSYAPLAMEFQQQLSLDSLVEFIDGQELALKDVVLEHIGEIYQRYINVPVEAYPPEYQWAFNSGEQS